MWRPLGFAGIEALEADYVRQDFSPHRHEGYLVGVIERGVHAVRCRGVRWYASEGTVCTLDPGEVHHGGAAVRDGWRQRILYVEPEIVRDVLEDALDRPVDDLHFEQCFRADRRAAAALSRLHRALGSRDEALEVQTVFHAVMGRVLTRYGRLVEAPSPPPSPPDVRLSRAREFVHEHACERIELADIARAADLRRRQLIDGFVRAFGLPPHRYQRQVRIDRARRLLASGMAPSQVAHETGFTDQSHFIRHFRAVLGVTPARYHGVES
ncbi:AraC family ligand binding domain-containing protein [Pendulispora albinea]|uniref:AraC family transcriptional regulator n=1 Tax=Pendulispora albinea TaxID=2741071 RepID=A0ABZ2MBH8_9BACT